MVWYAPQDELVRQHVDDVGRSQPPVDPDRQALPRELVDQVEHSEPPSVMGPAFDEVVRPDMVRTLGSQTDAGPVVEPEPALPRLFLWNLQPLPPPDPFDALVIYTPAAVVQHPGDHAIPIAPELPRQLDDVLGQPFFVRQANGRLALRRAMLPQCAANPALRCAESLPHLVDTSTAAGRAQAQDS